MSRDTKDLIPSFRAEVIELLELSEIQGYKMKPYFTLRDPWEQAKLWRQSRSTDEINRAVKRLNDSEAPFLAEVLNSVGSQHGSHVTNALPGMSWHQWGEAVDCFLESPTKSAIWDGKHPGYKTYAENAVDLELTAGYYWTSPFDPGHVQMRSGSVRDLYTWQEVDQHMRDRFAMNDPSFNTPLNIVDDLEGLKEEFKDEDVDQNEVDIMARTVFGEARGESKIGKTAVGYVIMNRVKYAKDRGGILVG